MVQVPLNRLLLETDAPDGRPRLGEPYDDKLLDIGQEQGENCAQLNCPANIRCHNATKPDIHTLSRHVQHMQWQAHHLHFIKFLLNGTQKVLC